jgi:hypothetical protein
MDESLKTVWVPAMLKKLDNYYNNVTVLEQYHICRE